MSNILNFQFHRPMILGFIRPIGSRFKGGPVSHYQVICCSVVVRSILEIGPKFYNAGFCHTLMSSRLDATFE